MPTTTPLRRHTPAAFPRVLADDAAATARKRGNPVLDSVAARVGGHTGTVVAEASAHRRLGWNPDTARHTALGQKG